MTMLRLLLALYSLSSLNAPTSEVSMCFSIYNSPCRFLYLWIIPLHLALLNSISSFILTSVGISDIQLLIQLLPVAILIDAKYSANYGEQKIITLGSFSQIHTIYLGCIYKSVYCCELTEVSIRSKHSSEEGMGIYEGELQ